MARPTDLVDPEVEVRPALTQVDDLLSEIGEHTRRDERVLASWCSIMPGQAARSRRLRCLPRPGAFSTAPASCSRLLTQV